MAFERRRKASGSGAAAFAVALSAALVLAPDLAGAQGFFDFLFGGPQQQPPPPVNPELPPPPPGIGRVAPAPLGAPERVNEGAGSTGHTVAFCVRLCDGQHFPLEQMANSTPVDTCHSICPSSQTKVFFGAEIDAARASDGSHYGDLKTAFLYRKQLVANCTCNGKDAFGLVSFDVKTDPTLRPGDVVSTKEGLETYNGKAGKSAAFSPVTPAALSPQLNSMTSPPPAAASDAPAAPAHKPSPPAANPPQH